MPRHIRLDGVDNFRDFGGYRTAGGGRMNSDVFFRSASHARATEADLEAIGALGIAVVIDLRRKAEREREPSRRHPQFCAHVIVNDDESAGDSWQTHIRTSDLSPESCRDYMLGYYREAPFEARHIDLFARHFEAIERAASPILIHCAAGKDRTGILAALTQHLADVAPDDIMEDYLLTNDPERMAQRIGSVRQAVTEASGRTPSEAALNVMMGVSPEYLATALRAMSDAFGSVDGYLEEALGLDAGRRERLRERMVA